MANANLSNAALGLHPNAKNLLGMKFGRLTVVSISGRCETGGVLWNCRCDCGSERVIVATILTKGRYKSCGCLSRELSASRKITHGMTGSPEWVAWSNIIARCTNPNHEHFADYGGRGIAVCERWRESFVSFLEDVGRRPSKRHTIDRHPNQNGDYEPSNCRWATMKEQANNRRNNVLLAFQGETLSVAQWTEKLGFREGVIYSRLHAGWSAERTLSTPARICKRH